MQRRFSPVNTALIRQRMSARENLKTVWDRPYNEYKYVIAGEAEDEREIEVVAKLRQMGDTVVITVYCVY